MTYVIVRIELDHENTDLIQIALRREKVPGEDDDRDYNRMHTNYVPLAEASRYYVGQVLVLA